MIHSVEIDHIYSAPGPSKSWIKTKKIKMIILQKKKENGVKSPLHLKTECNNAGGCKEMPRSRPTLQTVVCTHAANFISRSSIDF